MIEWGWGLGEWVWALKRKPVNKSISAGNSLVVQGLGLCTFSAEELGSVPGQKLRSHKPCGCGTVKKENRTRKILRLKWERKKRGRFKSENLRATRHQTQSKFVFNTLTFEQCRVRVANNLHAIKNPWIILTFLTGTYIVTYVYYILYSCNKVFRVK